MSQMSSEHVMNTEIPIDDVVVVREESVETPPPTKSPKKRSTMTNVDAARKAPRASPSPVKARALMTKRCSAFLRRNLARGVRLPSALLKAKAPKALDAKFTAAVEPQGKEASDAASELPKSSVNAAVAESVVGEALDSI